MGITRTELLIKVDDIIKNNPEKAEWYREQKAIYTDPSASSCTKNRTANLMFKAMGEKETISRTDINQAVASSMTKRITDKLNKDPSFAMKLKKFLEDN